MSLLEIVKHTLDVYENELGSRSRGLAYLQSDKERLLNIIQRADERIEQLYKQNNELRNELEVSIPNFNIKMNLDDVPSIRQITYIEWELPYLKYRYPAPDYAKQSEKFWKLAKWQSYRAFCKRLRKDFDIAFNNYYKMATSK